MTEKRPTSAKPSIADTASKTKDAPAPKATSSRKVVPKKPVVPNVEPSAPMENQVKEPKIKKAKMVRDSFTMPADDYSRIHQIKERCLKAGVSVKKSEVLRAALVQLSTLADGDLINAVKLVEPIKTGRPPKS